MKVMANKENYLGEFEHIILLTLLRLGDDNAYGMNVRATLKELVNRDVSIGALYTTLERLEKKGFINSKIGDATSERGGRAKRYFKLNAKGKEALKATRDNLDILWQGVSLRQMPEFCGSGYAK